MSVSNGASLLNGIGTRRCKGNPPVALTRVHFYGGAGGSGTCVLLSPASKMGVHLGMSPVIKTMKNRETGVLISVIGKCYRMN